MSRSVAGVVFVLSIAVIAVSVGRPIAAAVFEPREFATPADEARYRAMIDELRCPKCQNQNIAESDAPLAKDLRREVFRMIEEGRADAEILDYMVTRYGDFVLYRPRFGGVTLLLWLGPVLLITVGVVVLWQTLRRRGRKAPAGALSPQERARLDAMLKADDV